MNHIPTITADPVPSECPPSADGILACLRMLAAEATTLHLARTADALQAAIETCTRERLAAEGGPLLRH